MAKKKTLSDILQTPIDFIYLWASDAFIAQLGSKAKIIKQKKYNQYQTLWTTMLDNSKGLSSRESQIAEYDKWVERIGAAITDVYGMTPATILKKLALGEQVLGKDWNQGVYGCGIGNTKVSFDQAPGVYVDGSTGKILDSNFTEFPNQTPIYDGSGYVSGYSCLNGDVQFQSAMGSEGKFGAYSYSKSNGTIQDPNGNVLNASAGSFWQNANNYMPIIEDTLSWLQSIVESYLPGKRTVLTTENTVPKQTEWVEEDGNGGLLAGGIALAALALITMEQPKKKNK